MVMTRRKRPQHLEDIVIHNDGSGLFAIVRVDGERIGMSDNRRDAMLRACAVADRTGVTVWVCIDPLLHIYTEVLCP
jgi:hypothetical protein